MVAKKKDPAFPPPAEGAKGKAGYGKGGKKKAAPFGAKPKGKKGAKPNPFGSKKK